MGGFRAFAAIYLYKYNPANDTSIKKKIFSAWEKNHPKRTGIVHVSDLSYCFRKSVFSRTDEPTSRSDTNGHRSRQHQWRWKASTNASRCSTIFQDRWSSGRTENKCIENSDREL